MLNLKNIAVAITVFSLTSVIMIMGRAMGWHNTDLEAWEMVYAIPLLLLPLLPFVLMVIFIRKVYKNEFSKPARIAICVTALLVDVISLLTYADAFFRSTSSTAGLAFLSVPIVSLALLPFAYYITKWLVKTLNKQPNAAS